MANMASTSYKIVGKKENLQKIYDLWKEFDTNHRPPMDGAADPSWEGNIIQALGIKTENRCLRGFIQTCEFDGDILNIEAEEAWNVTDFRTCLTEHFKEIQVFFCCEELSSGIFQTNDKDGEFFGFRYLMDISVNHQSDWEYYDSQEQTLAHAANLLGQKSITMQEVEKFNEEHETIGDESENYIHIYELEIVED